MPVFLTQRRSPAIRLALAVVALAVAGAGLSESESFGWPAVSDCRPYGALVCFGSPAPAGTQLRAKIMGEVVAETAVSIAGWYSLVIPPDNALTTIRDGWRPGDRITIRVDDHEARPEFIAFEGSRQIDLVVSSMALDVKKSTWGKIKALFR